MCAQPKAFGVAAGALEPAHGLDVADERYRAAMLQHVMAVTARGELLKSQGITPATFVARFGRRGLGADRVRRIFRGETMAQLTDVVFWTTHIPAVGLAISEWIGTPAEQTMAGGSEGAPSTAKLGGTAEGRSARFEHELADAREIPRRDGGGAPLARRTPQNPYVRPHHRIR